MAAIKDENSFFKCTFDRWYEALFKEQIWHQWILNGLVKSMDIPTQNTLAHLYVDTKTPASMEKQMGWADLKRGLLAQRAQCSHSNQTFYFL